MNYTDKQVEVTGSVASDKKVEVTGSVASDKQVEVAGSVVSDKQVEVAGSVVSDKQVDATGSVASDKQVDATGSVASDKQVDATGSVTSDKQVDATGSVASDKQVDATGSVASDKQVDATGSVTSDKQVDATGFVTSDKQVEVTGSVTSDKQEEVKEVSRIRLHAQDEDGVCLQCMVVYNHRFYVVHQTGLTVYCYVPDGSLSHKYFHTDEGMPYIRGMCLMKNGDKAMLVVSDRSYKSLIWIKIVDDVTMVHHHTQQLNYSPRGVCNDQGDLLVCDVFSHKIHRYRHDGQTLAVINLPDNVSPWRVARHGDQYVVSDYLKNQVVMIDNKGQEKTRYNGDIRGVELGTPRAVITDPHRGVLIADLRHNQVLLLRRTGDVVKILDQHVTSPTTLYLDTDHHRLYVSGRDQHVFVFNYTLPTSGKELTEKITKLDLKVKM